MLLSGRFDALGAAARVGSFSVRAVTAAVCAVAVEAVAITAALALYPAGLGAERERAVAAGAGDGQDLPVLLVHGMSSNRGIFNVLRRSLRRAGFRYVTVPNYTWLTCDIRSAARLLAAEVERLCERTGEDQVHVIGHSLGGLVARYYVQCLGGDARVHTLITLGSPHGGTLTALLPLPHPALRQLRPGSELLAELSAPASGCATRFVAFHSDVDQLIVPTANARLVHPDLEISNVPVRAVGHVSLPLHTRVIREIRQVLADAPVPLRAKAAA